MSDAASASAQHRRRIAITVLAGLLAVAGLAVPAVALLSSRTSSASFADSEVLSANRLGAAVLDIEVEATNEAEATGVGGQAGPPVTVGDGALFSAVNLAPGDRVSGQLEMTNAGDLTLRYGLTAVGQGDLLGQWLRFEVWAGTGVCSPDQPGLRVIEDVEVGVDPVSLVDLVRDDEANVLRPGESFLWCVGASLPLETPNDVQGARFDLTMLVTAEQVVEDER